MATQFLILVGGAILTVAVSTQAPALRIVVLEGENAVNIIQQNTAVRAVVEVRDRNNLPVSGATVTFGVTGQGGATVAGSQTISVATNAAGQASLGGMTPASSGGLQISVNASYQGVNAAPVTISQTVVATAAAAAGGGGISTAAIVGIVGGVGAIGGGVAVLGGGGDDTQSDRGSGNGSGNSSGPAPVVNCTFTVSPTDLLLVPIAGGTFPFTVVTSPPSCRAPEWAVDTNLASSFVSASPVRGSGNGTFTLTFAPFTPTQGFPSRSGAVGAAGSLIRFFQPTRF